MYKVFVNDRLLLLTDKIQKNTRFNFFLFNSAEVNHHVDKLFEENSQSVIYLYYPNLELLWQKFKDKFTLVEAGGGIVANGEKEILFIFRNGKWDLPKGKVDEGENIDAAALREVKEECGIENVSIVGPFTDTYHIYKNEDKTILKITHWYHMQSNGKEPLVPQTDEGIETATWKNKEQIQEALKNSYANIALLFEEDKPPS